VLSAALKRARALRLIVTNPAEDVKRPKVERQEIAYLEPSDAAKLLQAAAGLRLRAPIFIALATGLRRGELLALRWPDLDLDRGSLTVARALEQTKEGLRFKTPKTKRSRRTITLSPSAVELLLNHKAQQAKERLALGLGRDNRGLVFTLLDGSVMNPKSFSKEFARLVKKTEIRRVTFHGLRHTHFTNLLREGVHPKIASERAGHASVAITMDVYSHAIPSLQEDAALRIDGALRRLLES
jgi:integrase